MLLQMEKSQHIQSYIDECFILRILPKQTHVFSKQSPLRNALKTGARHLENRTLSVRLSVWWYSNQSSFSSLFLDAVSSHFWLSLTPLCRFPASVFTQSKIYSSRCRFLYRLWFLKTHLPNLLYCIIVDEMRILDFIQLLHFLECFFRMIEISKFCIIEFDSAIFKGHNACTIRHAGFSFSENLYSL